MTTMSNPIQQPVRTLFKRLNIINGLLWFLDRRTQDMKKQITAVITSKTKKHPVSMFSCCLLSIVDLSASEMAGYATGSFHAQDQEYIDSLAELVRQNSAVAISQGYEAFETFLKEQLSVYYHINQSDADTQRLQKFNTSRKVAGLNASQLEYWRAFVLHACYGSTNNDKYFKLLRDHAPGFATIEKTNPKGIDLTEWYNAVSEVRHAVTHAYFTIKRARISTWPQSRLDNLFAWFPVEPVALAQGHKLRINHQTAQTALSYVSEYAFQAFKHLSIAKGYKWDMLNGAI